MKIVITGSEGMLGCAVSDVLSADYETKPYTHKELDITKKECYENLSEGGKPDVIIHCAAYTNVNGAQLDVNRDNVLQTNVLSMIKLCEYCNKNNVKLIYPQTFLVLNTKQDPYKPVQNFFSINKDEVFGNYAKSKYEAEKIILRHLRPNQRMIIRLGGFFGGGEQGDKKFVGLFLNKLIPDLINRKADSIEIGDRIWQPTWTIDIANVIKYVVINKWKSFYQYAGYDIISFAEFAQMLLHIIGDQKINIITVPTDKIEASVNAPRPGKVILESSKELIEAGLVYPLKPRLRNYLSSEWNGHVKLLKKELGIESASR